MLLCHAQVASFLGELEASGLLTDTDEPPSSSIAGNDTSTTTSAAAAAAVPAAVQAAPSAKQPDATAAPIAGHTSESVQQTSSDTAQASSSQPAQQRVLGGLEGTAGQQWFEVMDMASRKVYFWNASSNEVLWSPPSGAKPRSTDEAAAAAADSSEKDQVPTATAADTDAAGAEQAQDTAQLTSRPVSTAVASDTEASGSLHATEPHSNQSVPFGVHQLELLTLLLQQEATSHHLQEPHALLRLCIQAATLHGAYTAILDINSGASADNLVLPKTAFDAWAQQQFDALQAQAEEAVQAASSAEDSASQPVQPATHGGAHAQPQIHSNGPRSMPEAQPSEPAEPEDGELTPDSSQESGDDMDIDAPGARPALPGDSTAAWQNHLSQYSAAVGSDDDAPPLPEEPSSSQQSAGAAAAGEQLAASMAPGAGHAEAATALRDRRKEFFAQPVRSTTPPTTYPAAASYSTEDATYHPEPQVMLC